MKFKMTVLFLGFYLLANFANAQSISISHLKSSGNACPAQSVQAVLSPDGSALSILFSDFHADVGGPLFGAVHRDCEVLIEIAKPSAVTVQLGSIDLRGFVSLDAGMRAQEWSEFEMDNGRASHHFARTQFSGPISQTYILSGQWPESSQLSNRCNSTAKTNFKINSHFRVEGGRPDRVGTLSIDSLDGLMVHTYHLAWSNCVPGNRNH
jgi:hypothetical protein